MCKKLKYCTNNIKYKVEVYQGFYTSRGYHLRKMALRDYHNGRGYSTVSSPLWIEWAQRVSQISGYGGDVSGVGLV